MALFFSFCLPSRKAGGLQIPFCQGIAVADYSFTLDALALKPSSFCNVGVKAEFLSSEQDFKVKPQLKALKAGVETGDIVSKAAEWFGVKPEQILTKGKKKNLARDVAIYLS